MRAAVSNEITVTFNPENAGAEAVIKGAESHEGGIWGLPASSDAGSEDWLKELAMWDNCGCGC